MFRLLLFITTLFCESIAGSEKTHRRALLSERTNKFDDRSTIASTVTAVYKHAYTTKPERRETWGLAKTIFNKVEDKTKNTLNKVKDTTKDITDKVKDTTKDAIGDIKDNAEDLTDKVKDTANGAADKIKDTAKDTTDKVKDKAEDVVDKVSDTVDELIDCAKDPHTCAKKNGIFDLLPECLLDGKPEKCFIDNLLNSGKELATNTARLQQIAATSMWEVGYTLLRIAKEARKRRLDDCKNHEGTISIPLKFSFKTIPPFVQVKDIQLKTCHMPQKYLKDIYNTFKDCFLGELKNLGPKIIALWKGQEIGSAAQCNSGDNFAIVLKLQLGAATKVKFLSGGGGIGLAFGCKDGEMKQEMVFDYEAGFKFIADPKPLTISLSQDVAYLKEWPTHHSEFFKDLGQLRLTFGFPKSASMIVQFLLNQVCQKGLPEAVSKILCGKAIPQDLQLFFDPPKFNLDFNTPEFEHFKMVGMQLGWTFNLYEMTPGAKAAAKGTASGMSATTKSGKLVVKSVKPTKRKWTDFSSPSVEFHYGNMHVFGSLLIDAEPCKGFPGYDDCQDVECQNDGQCIDLEDAFECRCTNDFRGTFCETANPTSKAPTTTTKTKAPTTTTKAPSTTNTAPASTAPASTAPASTEPANKGTGFADHIAKYSNIQSEATHVYERLKRPKETEMDNSSEESLKKQSPGITAIALIAVGSVVGVIFVSFLVASRLKSIKNNKHETRRRSSLLAQQVSAPSMVIVENPLGVLDDEVSYTTTPLGNVL
jgi:uncharacterized protein YjbJ (UPF0337 family)